MSSTTNYGTQVILFPYKSEADSDKFNKLLKELTLGVYSGLQINKIANNKISIGPGSLIISDGTYTIRMNTTVTTTQDILCSSTDCYVVARWSYLYTETNYVDFLCTATPQVHDIILGKLEYTGPSLESVDYSERSYGNLHRTKIFIDSITNTLYLNPGTNFWFVDSDGYTIEYVEILQKTSLGVLSSSGFNYLLYDGSSYTTSTSVTGLAYDSSKNGWYDSSNKRVLAKVRYDGATTITAVTAFESLGVSSLEKATGAEVDTGTDDEKYVTPKAMEDSSYTKTSDIPVKATGAEIDTGTDDDKFATPKAIADSGLAFTSDIPVKATGAEIDTGTDDAKFATPKAIEDSSYMKNPMTTAGDIIYGGASGAPTRLEIGTEGYNLTVLNGANAYSDKFKISSPQGYLTNGRIEATVSSSNLTLALKGKDGNDPSATNPVYCMIGNTRQAVTSALSVTKNAGTNWFNSGATGLAAQEIDYFAYLGYNATDGVVIGFARIPFGRVYGDFSTTTTNEKYCAISTITHAASTDEYEVIGRFNATLSATASFNWSIPATPIVVNRPIFETRVMLYTPTLTGFSSTGSYIIAYRIVGQQLILNFGLYSGSSTSNANTFTATLPFSRAALPTVRDYYGCISGTCMDNGSWYANTCFADIATANILTLWRGGGGATSWTTSNRKDAWIYGQYTI